MIKISLFFFCFFPLIPTDIHFHRYQQHKLPITMDPLKYGKLLDKIGNRYFIQINNKNIAIINHLDGQNEVKFFKSGELTYEYIDKFIDEITFKRILGKKEFIFKNNELLLFKVEKSAKFINPLIRSETLSNKFLTMDIETFIKDGIHIPYCISFYDGENTFSYYLTDFKDSNSMIIKAILDLMIKKYDNYKIYLHNLANFDAIFLLKIIIKLGICKPIIHHDRIISIQLNYGDHVVFFRDSQQLLIGSLAKLGKSFGVKTLKSIFPYFFVDENNLDYVGSIPNINFFDNISRNEYLEYYDNFNDKLWSMKDETIKYCNIDCISLYQIILKFNALIFDLFNLNIHKFPTLPSLALGVFRSNFLKINTIPQISGQVAKDIRMSYTGGACDMYIPKSEKDSNLYAYDVNSLYPSVMKDNDMPIGKPTFFKTRFFDTFRP